VSSWFIAQPCETRTCSHLFFFFQLLFPLKDLHSASRSKLPRPKKRLSLVIHVEDSSGKQNVDDGGATPDAPFRLSDNAYGRQKGFEVDKNTYNLLNFFTSGPTYAASFSLIFLAIVFQIFVVATGGGFYGNSERYSDEDDIPFEKVCGESSQASEVQRPYDVFRLQFAE